MYLNLCSYQNIVNMAPRLRQGSGWGGGGAGLRVGGGRAQGGGGGRGRLPILTKRDVTWEEVVIT